MRHMGENALQRVFFFLNKRPPNFFQMNIIFNLFCSYFKRGFFHTRHPSDYAFYLVSVLRLQSEGVQGDFLSNNV